MAIDAARVGSKRGRQQAAFAAKARRQRIMLIIGGVLLLGLLALEGPKTLKALHGSSPAVAPVAPVTAVTPAAPVGKPVNLRAFARFAAKDPFVAQVGATTAAAAAGATPTTGTPATPPPVRSSNFVAKDPFVQQLTLVSTTPASTATSSPPSSQAGGASAGKAPYIVLVASVPVSSGHGAAIRAAATARKSGVQNVKIVDSSSYATLRTGFYAVYSGPYSTLSQALNALSFVRGRGYVSAYTRRLGH